MIKISPEYYVSTVPAKSEKLEAYWVIFYLINSKYIVFCIIFIVIQLCSLEFFITERQQKKVMGNKWNFWVSIENLSF